MAALELSGFPLTVPSLESTTPFLPICSSILLPSWVYFCTIPDGALPIQMLLSLSTWQEWSLGSSCLRSPQEFTTLPSASNSMIGGASRPVFNSTSSTSCRFRMKTWPAASTQVPPSPPRIHWFGSGFGQLTSATYLGGVRLCALARHAPAIAAATVRMVPTRTRSWLRVMACLLREVRRYGGILTHVGAAANEIGWRWSNRRIGYSVLIWRKSASR